MTLEQAMEQLVEANTRIAQLDAKTLQERNELSKSQRRLARLETLIDEMEAASNNIGFRGCFEDYYDRLLAERHKPERERMNAMLTAEYGPTLVVREEAA
jgi:multidrug efflux pump subunit AcrA (membrane-fusion protein)